MCVCVCVCVCAIDPYSSVTVPAVTAAGFKRGTGGDVLCCLTGNEDRDEKINEDG